MCCSTVLESISHFEIWSKPQRSCDSKAVQAINCMSIRITPYSGRVGFDGLHCKCLLHESCDRLQTNYRDRWGDPDLEQFIPFLFWIRHIKNMIFGKILWFFMYFTDLTVNKKLLFIFGFCAGFRPVDRRGHLISFYTTANIFLLSPYQGLMGSSPWICLHNANSSGVSRFFCFATDSNLAPSVKMTQQ